MTSGGFRPLLVSGGGRRVLVTLLALAALGMTVPGTGWSQAQKKSCVDCHQDFKKRLKAKFVHAPVKEGCEKCHMRHGFAQKLVLTKKLPDLCIDCHASVGNELASANVHGALTEGGCYVCHDSHASDNQAYLRPGEAAGKGQATKSVCLVCHESLSVDMENPNAHAPFKKGECTACHKPHASDRPHLLVADEGQVCGACHKNVLDAHKQVAGVNDLACTDCHDPHLASKKMKLAATAHPPFAAGECGSCHTLKDGQVEIPDDFPPANLCQRCHADVASRLAGEESHFGSDPMRKGGTKTCLKCHDGHRSREKSLLAKTQNDLCRSCHESLPQKASFKGTMHPPFAGGECSTCHDPHGGSAPHKLVKAPGELCASCHEAITRVPAAGKVTHASMKAGDCTQCHSGHASAEPALLTRSVAETCTACHAKESHQQAHQPYLTGSCESCHRNHSHEKGLLAASVKETCGACHAQQIKALSAATKHPPAQEDDCLSCHLPHGSENGGLLAKSQKDLCWGCHDVDEIVVHAAKSKAEGGARDGATAGVALHRPVADGNCSACHDAHGSPLPSLLARSGDTMCYGCHAQEKVDFAAGTVHAPVAEGKCAACHTPHGSEFGSLAVQDQPGMCTQCHDFSKPPLKGAHTGVDVSSAKCTMCHAPHSSPKAALLNAVVHEPFADGDCETCHELTKAPDGAVKLGAVSPTLCTDCHDDKQSGAGHQHVEGIACVKCHQPHSSPSEHLLVSPGRLCQSCHEDVLRPAGSAGKPVYVHKPAQAGGCRQCHKLHDPAGSPLLASAEKDLCASCHESIQARKGDRTQHAPFGKGQCSRCHETHASSEPHLLKESEGELCTSCHGLTSPKLTRAHKQVPLTAAGCVSCHDPHSTKAAGSSLVYEKKHPPYADGDCDVCHDASGKPNTAVSTCVDCHEGQRGYVAVHDAGRGGDRAGMVEGCLDCHSPHAGHASLLVRGSEKETCLQCHDRAEFTKPFAHAALDDGCSTCHNVHDNNIAELRGPRVNDLCGDCHDAATTHAHRVSGVPDPRTGAELNCVSCHKPHSADHEHLLPFDPKRDLCVQCHENGSTATD